MGARAVVKAFVICQPEKVSIPSERGEIPRLHRLSSRYPNGRRITQGRT